MIFNWKPNKSIMKVAGACSFAGVLRLLVLGKKTPRKKSEVSVYTIKNEQGMHFRQEGPLAIHYS
jgi:hypothetical protein